MKITHDSFGGRCSDNPRALHEALVVRGDDNEHVRDPGRRSRETFCHREDGHATARVLQLITPTEVTP